MIRLLKNMYSKITLTVQGDNRFFNSDLGLLQGESTSPILFSLYINDLETSINDEWSGTEIQNIIIKLLMFADDTAIFSETREGLQKAIDDLDRYCSKWGITININKTKIVVFRKAGRLSQTDKWAYRGTEIEIVSFFKYLGCHLASSGSFNKCTQELIKSARRALFSLRIFFAKNNELLPSTKLMFFDTMIKPILFYGCEVWGLNKVDSIETFYLAFLKSILHVKTSTTNNYVYGELGVYPLYIERQVRVLKYWSKIINPENEKGKFVNCIYKELHQLSISDPGSVTWATLVRDTLYKCNLGIYWERQAISDDNFFLSLVRKRLQDNYRTEWAESVMNSTDGRIYKHIKESFCYESYLDNIQNRALRHALTKIRLSSHRYNIETGRWGKNKIPRADRQCTLCNVIEDEFHVLIICPRYVNERRGRLPENLITNPCTRSFYRLLQCKDVHVQTQLGLLCLSVQCEYMNNYV